MFSNHWLKRHLNADPIFNGEQNRQRQSPTCMETTPVHVLTRHNRQINVDCDTLLKPSTALSVVLTTSRPSCSGHLIKPQTLIGLINVPAKFHKWGIDWNWFHSLIHLLKWHSFIHALTCFASSHQRACYHKLRFHRKDHFRIYCRAGIIATTHILRVRRGTSCL